MKKENKVLKILIVMLIILEIIVCFESMKLMQEYKELQKEKTSLELLTETQKSMISDLEENNRDLFEEIQNLEFGGR